MRIQLDHAYSAFEISKITYGRCQNDRKKTSTHLCTDTRELRVGDIFVALRGERDDGHGHLREAWRMGAVILLCEEGYAPEESCAIEVKNVEKALIALASEARHRIDPTVIAITGSVGKTTTKNTVAAVLSTRFRTHKTYGNFNNLLGVCLTLLSMPKNTEILVCELGMNHAGEIRELSRLVLPDIAIITNVGRAHIGQLGSREAIARAKLEILEGCREGALYIFCGDESLLSPVADTRFLTLSVGRSHSCLCRFENETVEHGQIVADFVCNATLYPHLTVPGIGLHMASCAAFAVAVGQTLGIPQDDIRAALASISPEDMRQRLLEIGEITVIEDCYNASPESVEAALASLCATARETGGRALALLGDMLELGRDTRILHEEVGHACTDAGIDLLFTFGAAAESIAVGAARRGMKDTSIFHNPNPSAPEISAAQICREVRAKDVLLVKASRALSAERIIEYLKSDLKSRKGGTQ